MDSKNPMRAEMLELGREHSEGKKKNCEEKYEKILMFQKSF